MSLAGRGTKGGWQLVFSKGRAGRIRMQYSEDLDNSHQTDSGEKPIFLYYLCRIYEYVSSQTS